MVGKIDRARFALRRLIESVRPRDEVFVGEFNTRPVLLQDFTDSRLLLTQAVTSLRPVGGTALYDAMIEGLRHVKQGRNQKKALIVISDGEDLNSFGTLEQAVNTARRSGVVVYAIGIGVARSGAATGGGFSLGPFQLGRGGFSQDHMDERTLREITEQTGGKLSTMSTHDVLANESALNDAMETISRELRLQYSLGYTPTRSGAHYRNTRVAVRRPDADELTVRTQKGYASDSREQTARRSEQRIQQW
jgi:Ca-activated chloride channel family protein